MPKFSEGLASLALATCPFEVVPDLAGLCISISLFSPTIRPTLNSRGVCQYIYCIQNPSPSTAFMYHPSTVRDQHTLFPQPCLATDAGPQQQGPIDSSA